MNADKHRLFYNFLSAKICVHLRFNFRKANAEKYFDFSHCSVIRARGVS